MRITKHLFLKLSCLTNLICIFLFSGSGFSQTIDLTKPVGSINGKADISPTGGISYLIPIDVLKGTNGMEPALSLAYNSQASEGVAGFGWSLSGLSVISRQGNRQYYNGKNSPVNYANTNDAFLLDGQRLFPTTGNNGDNGTVYGTENETFSKIESFGGNNTNGPDWFRVTRRDGMIYEYGTDAASKLFSDNYQNVMLWFLKRVIDKSGNYYEYTYNVNNADRYFTLTEINYTGNLNTSQIPYNKIQFTYTTLPNWQNRKSYDGGAAVTSPYLLDMIYIRNQNSVVVKSYQFNYTSVKNQSFLSSVSETGSDGSALNPLIFQYGSNTTAPDVNVSSTYTGFNTNSTYTTFAGDVTGDGKQDLLTAKFTFDNSGIPHYSSYDVLDNFPSYGNPSVAYSYYINQSGATQVQGSSNGYYNFLTYDYDGDGKQDVLMISNSISGTQKYFNGIKINYSRRYTSGPSYQTVDYPQIPNDNYYGNYQNIYTQGTSYIPGDFDGDGSQDYIMIVGLSSTNYYKAFFSSPAKNIINQEIIGFGVGGNPTDPFYATTVASTQDVMPIDFDGDGKMEILVQKPGGSYILSVFPVSPSSGYSYGASVIYTFSDILSGYRVFPGDFNGDGKTDLLVRTAQYNPFASWNLLYSTGTSFKSYPFIYQNRIYLDGDNGGSAHHLVIADFNGDGKTDIWHSMDLTTTTSKHALYISNGVPLDYNNSNSAFTVYTYNYNAGINRDQVVQSVIGDLNNDGKPDIFSINGSNAKIIYPQPDKEENLMVKTTNGIGVETRFTYVKGYGRSSLYDYDNPSIVLGQANGNPYTVLKTPMNVVYYMIEDNGMGGNIFTTMQYEDAMYHPLKGFLGFKKVISNNSSTGLNATSYSEMNTSFLIPLLYRTTTDNNVNLLSESVVTNNIVSINPGNYYDKRYTSLPSSTKSFNYLNGSGTETVNTYDSYGNITASTSTTGSFSGTTISPIETVTNTTSYITANTPIASVPSSNTVTKTRLNQPSSGKTVSYTYNGSGLPATITDFAGTAVATTSTYTYDNFGNAASITMSAPGATTPVITNAYDNFGRNLLTKTASGSGITKTETYSYNILNDQIAAVTGSDRLTTTYTYDGFSRLTQTGLPDGNIMLTSIDWDQSYGRYYKTTSRAADNGLYTRTYFDVLNREIKKEVSEFNGRLRTSTTEYNNLGLVSRKILPYWRFEPIKAITYSYDGLGRITATSDDNTTTSYSYSLNSGGLYTATMTNGAYQSSSKTSDASGRIVYANDNGGQLDFTYDSWGNPLETKFGSTTLIANVYDSYGRKISLTDKNAGTISYEYNSLGKLTKQTDANNNVHNFSYDAFGRIISKTGPAGTTSYGYYNDPATGKCNDKISSINGFAGDLKTYQYNNLQQTISETTSFGGQVFTKTMAYDAFGNLTNTTYPSGVTINDVYDRNGNLTQTSMTYAGNTQVLFNGYAQNNKGVYTYYTYGNGLTSTVECDAANGTPTRYFTSGIQDLNLSFDFSSGNLMSRYDAIKNLNETFTYDNLNRLTSASVNNTPQFTMTYDGSTNNSLGNIQSKSDIGNYRYHSQKINAVRFITTNSGIPTNPPNVISVNTQAITYTPFLKIATVSENGYQLAYSYGEDEERLKSILTQNGNLIETKYYAGAYELQIKGSITREIHYVSAGNGSCAIIVKEGGVVTPYFVYSDHLGSLLTLTDINGNIVTEQNFDAWGRKRNPNDWTYNNVPSSPDWLFRGFTGHEHLKEFALINMNGRMYDPATGRMLSPDNYVPSPYSTQGYNRYGYAMNNPLIYRDADGQFIHLIIGALIGGIVNLVSGALHGNIHSFWDGLKSFGIGAVQGALGAAIGYGGFGWGAAGRAFSAGFFSNASVLGSIATGIGSSFLPAIPIGNNFSISPAFAFGTHGLSTGLSANFHSGNFSLGVGFSNDGTNSHVSYGGGYDDGKFGISYYRNEFSGEHKQTTGQWGVHLNRISLTFEEDHKAWTFLKNEDRWRTTGIGIGYNMKDGSQIYAGMRFMTGDRAGIDETNHYIERDITREGLFYGGYKNSNGLSYSAGADWEHGRAQVMDFVHKQINSPYFNNLEDQYPARGFFRYGNYNPFTYYW